MDELLFTTVGNSLYFTTKQQVAVTKGSASWDGGFIMKHHVKELIYLKS